MIHAWLVSRPGSAPTVGGFLYATLASFTLGLTLSTLRWFVLDRLHDVTGISRPAWDFSNLQEHIDAFQMAVDYHYRYYQFYGNSLMFLIVLDVFPQPLAGLVPGGMNSHRFALAALAALFFVASRDALRKYYGRAVALQVTPRRQKEPTNDQRIQAPKKARSPSPRTLVAVNSPARRRNRPNSSATIDVARRIAPVRPRLQAHWLAAALSSLAPRLPQLQFE